MSPRRPVIRYLGGKWKLAPWIIGHFPPHRVYVEPFGGAASVLLRKPKSYAEIYNDVDGEIVNLFRVLRDAAQAKELIRLLGLTPFARDEFVLARQASEDPVERARRMVIRSFMGHGSLASRIDRNTGFRANSNRSGTTPAHDWQSLPMTLPAVAKRLMAVVIENEPADRVISRFDGADTLIYADPPYVHATRGRGKVHPSDGYVHEMTNAQHIALLEQLREVEGMVVLSGYAHPIYDDRLKDWHRVEVEALADGARDRTEVLWINPAAAAAMPSQGKLFAGAH